jgi:predicted CXXCH cytochrome family protein
MLKNNGKLVALSIVLLAGAAFGVQKPTSQTETCVTSECHADYGLKTYVHGPVSLGDCKSCHEFDNEKTHTFTPTRRGRDLCEFCHLDQTSAKNIHEPLKDGDCTQCHDPHSSDNRFLLAEESVGALCRNCHQTGEGLKFLHGPMAVGECTVCHDSHSADYDNLLIDDPAELCLSCHVVTKDELTKFEFIHEPVRTDCAGCHSGHGADNPNMLKATAPELCYPCHEEIKNTAENAKYNHTIVQETGGCLKCHTPHASRVKYGLKAAPMTLCMSCHDKPVDLSKDKVLKAFSSEIANRKFLHGPVAQKDCKGCHISHGSEHFRLLVKEYPPQFYAPFSIENYDLCFSCHPDSLVLKKETENLTDFRNGRLNLHYLHVNKAERGRTCRSCHETHASNLPKHISETVPYGKWNMPIGFTKSETGGTCKPGCHMPTPYDRESPVDYSSGGTSNAGKQNSS